ncbi:MAG: 30S ribosomal protein S18 [Actinomycetes bacterium]|nr:MAG: 30S ribosomal protein S18 [Actinomycetota bacterium]
MARKNNRNPAPSRGRRQEPRRAAKSRPCPVCAEGGTVDWKDAASLRKYMSDRAKIRGRRVTGLCPKCQRKVARAIKNAREMALLPYISGR